MIVSIVRDAGKLLFQVGPMLVAAIFLAEAARIWFGDEKLKTLLAGRRSLTGRLRAAALGAVLPFCECGAFPVMLGLVRAGVPAGPVLTFFLVSPVVSMPVFLILIGLFNLPFAVFYLSITVTAGLAGGMLLELAGRRRGIFKPGIAVGGRTSGSNPRVSCLTSCDETPDNPGHAVSASAGACCGNPEAEPSNRDKPPGPAAIAAQAWAHTWKLLGKLAPYMAGVIAVSAALRNLVSPEWIRDALAARAPFDVLAGALAGIPIYTGDCAMIALVTPLMGATGALGAGIAFIIAGSATSVSGIVFMSSMFRGHFLVLYIITVFCIAVAAGYLVSLMPFLGRV